MKNNLMKKCLFLCFALGCILPCLGQVYTSNSVPISFAPDCSGDPLPDPGGLEKSFDSNRLPASGDDTCSGPVSTCLPFYFFGAYYTNVWINEDGNVTLDGPLSGHVPSSYVPALPLASLNRVIFAPFWADMDTTTNGSGSVAWGCGCAYASEGQSNVWRQAFGVTWRNVGYYRMNPGSPRLTNSFQMLIIFRPEIGWGSFDLQYRYASIQWDTAESCSGSGGLCNFISGTPVGYPARVGFASGINRAFELPGSANPNALLDGAGRFSLVDTNYQSFTNGVYTWHFTNRASTYIIAPGTNGP